jgi:2,4-dienoyl-CoA reductase-like NADH-dependent reductase (Old Yellow Enzyme family)
MPAFDLTNPATLNYVSELAEEVHLYGSKILINLGPSTVLMKGRMQSVEDLRALGKDGLWLPEDATEAEIEALLDKYVEQVQLYVDCGFDGVSDRIDACLCPFGSDGSAERGKSVEYRTRFELLAFRRLKEVFGPSFIIEGVMSGAMPYGYTGNSNVGYSLAEFIEFCKLADYDYFEKIAEGRGEDIRPCIWCNNCHGPSFDDGRHGPWVNRCSVNPEMGFEAQLGRLIREPGHAITAAERGHSVTLYEATGYLGCSARSALPSNGPCGTLRTGRCARRRSWG